MTKNAKKIYFKMYFILGPNIKRKNKTENGTF